MSKIERFLQRLIYAIFLVITVLTVGLISYAMMQPFIPDSMIIVGLLVLVLIGEGFIIFKMEVPKDE